MATDAIELRSFFEEAEVTPEVYERYADAAHASAQARDRFADLVAEYRLRVAQGTGDRLKLALGLLILGKFAEALESFEGAAATRTRHFYAAQAALGLARLDTALAELKSAARLGWDTFEIDMHLAAVHVRRGDLEAAEGLVKKHEAGGQDRAAWYFVRGLLADQTNQRELAIDMFEKALTLEPTHTEAMFRCARLYDLCGRDEQALELYQRLVQQPRAYVNALLNAAVIYEDSGRYDEAMNCLTRVLRAYPQHRRARLFFKDVESCQRMVLEEGPEPRVDPRVRLLEMPISELELSVRTRNCLKKMNIHTLADLLRLTEEELLAYKNFGETSLSEIKAVLSKKGLRLGQPLEDIDAAAVEEALAGRKPATLPSGQEAVLAKPVSEIELSVRARRCLQRLNVQTLGDLIQYSEQDLLATRNFGVTSLNEIKARLAEQGLQLSPKKPA